MTLKAVLDTNVLISGVLWRGTPFKILKWAEDQRLSIYSSLDILSEVQRVLNYPKFHKYIDTQQVLPEELLAKITSLCTIVSIDRVVEGAGPDADDDKFRAVPESWDEGVIREIASLGHEVGYHYECLATALIAQRRRGAEKKGDDSDEWKDGWTERLYELAYEDFCRNLERLRKLAPVQTVCMHGSPLSGIDNLDLCKRYDYKSLGLVAEPYLDVDFDEVFYLTDTGRRWDGEAVSVRDKVKAQSNYLAQSRRDAKKGQDDLDGWKTACGRDDLDDSDGWMKKPPVRWPRFHATFDIIRSVEAGRLPDKVMMTVHPQRWTDDPVAWTKELVLQNTKNVVKRILVRRLRRRRRLSISRRDAETQK